MKKKKKRKKKKKKKAAEPRSDEYDDYYADAKIEVNEETIKCVDANHKQFCVIMDSANSASDLTQIQMVALSASRGNHLRNGEDGIRLAVQPKQDAKGNTFTGTNKDNLYENLMRYRNGSANGKICIYLIGYSIVY